MENIYDLEILPLQGSYQQRICRFIRIMGIFSTGQEELDPGG
jgi:hypothetical protein